MRIAFVTPEFVSEPYFDGGLANYLFRVSTSLQALGHEVTVFVAADRNEVISYQGIVVHRVSTAVSWLRSVDRLLLRRLHSPLSWVEQSWRLNAALRRVHRQTPFALVQYASYGATGLFRLGSVPSVIRLSSLHSLLREAHGQAFSFNERLLEKLEQASLKRADGVFSPSRVVKQAAERILPGPVRLIESPFAGEAGTRDAALHHDLLEERRYLLFFGALSRLKGVDVIAACLPDLLCKHPDLCFVFVGKDQGFGSGSMMDHLWEEAGSFRGRVLYLGKLRHEQLKPVVEGALAVVLPSRIDNLPNACIEAMAAGKVVIGTEGASFEQLIEDGRNGFLCHPGDQKSLADALERVLRLHPEERQRIGLEAGATIERLSDGKVVDELVQFYSEIIERQE